MPVKRRMQLLYLAQYDPLSAGNGTSARGRLFLSHLTSDFDTTLVYVQGQFEPREEAALASRLTARYSVPFSNRGHFFFNRELYRQAVRATKENPPDVILADCDKTGLYAWLLSRQFDIPFVYCSHNVEYKRYISLSRTNPMRVLFVPALYLIERVSIAKAAATIAISSADARVFQRWYRDNRVITLPCAFDEKLFNPHQQHNVETKPVTVLMVANFGYPPNRNAVYKLLAKVIPEVSRQFPEVRFRFVGRDFPADVHHPSVEAAGFVTNLYDEYCRAAVVLVPIETGGGLKIKAIEALACGRSVVSTYKGMEGIDYAQLDLVQVGPLEDFAAMILRAITSGSRTTTKNWNHVRKAFGSAEQLQELTRILLRVAQHCTSNESVTTT